MMFNRNGRAESRGFGDWGFSAAGFHYSPRVCIAPFGPFWADAIYKWDPIRLSDLERFYRSLVANRASACKQARGT